MRNDVFQVGDLVVQRGCETVTETIRYRITKITRGGRGRQSCDCVPAFGGSHPATHRKFTSDELRLLGGQ